MIILTFDTEGRPVDAILSGQGMEPQDTGPKCRRTRVQGATMSVRIRPIDTLRYGQERSETLTWMSEPDYRRWLEKDLRATLRSLHANTRAWDEIIKGLEGRISSAAYDYPIIVQSQP